MQIKIMPTFLVRNPNNTGLAVIASSATDNPNNGLSSSGM